MGALRKKCRTTWDYYWSKVYKKETGAFLGRTGSSWLYIGIFYFIFYSVLAALITICVWVFYQTLDPRIPTWKCEQSAIGTNPGLGFRPMPTDNLESTLIWLKGSNQTEYEAWARNIMGFLDEYYTPGKVAKGTSPAKKCNYGDPPGEENVCFVDVRQWEECSPDQHFNYNRNSPCIFLKLNRIYGWIPEFYNDPNNLPHDMPWKLKEHIRRVPPHMRDNVWISCEGENPADIEYLGQIKYYPEIQGFPGYYYPYTHTDGYLSPLVAVRFMKPLPGIVINVECKAWAKNIKHSRRDKTGLVHFELLISS